MKKKYILAELEYQVSRNNCFVLMIHRLKNLEKTWSTD